MRAAVVAAVGLVSACASSRPGGVGDDDGDDAGPSVDAPIVDAPLATDGPPSDTMPQPGTTIYVAIAGNDGYTGLDPLQPVRSISVAIDHAAACTPAPCNVWISRGVYEEAIALRAGVDLYGGFALGFGSRDIAMHEVTITSNIACTVIADDLDAPTTIDGLTIRGADLSANFDGAASHTICVEDSADSLSLRGLRVFGGKGGRGVPGDDGVLIACTTSGGPGGAATDCSSGAGGLGDAGGDPASSGSPGGGGNSNCPNACPLVGHDGISGGTPGGNGANGADGAPGMPASDDDGAFTGGVWSGVASMPGARGLHGTGGAGGGSGGSKRFRACFGCGTLFGGHGGRGAPGGCGGGGGAPGSSGGASFAITILRSTVTAVATEINGGTGGRGGDGGDGHPGGPGGTNGDVDRQGAPQQRCGLIDYYAGGGAPGGIGGHGGHGGGGAGGPGGPAIGVALIEGALFVEGKPGTVVLNDGTAGAGGFGGSGAITAPSGVPGRVAPLASY